MPSSRISNSHDHHRRHRDNRDATDDSRPYSCPVPGCTRKFKRRFTLKEHIKTHTGEKAFTCPVPSCHKSFTTAGNLSRHKRLHPWLETTFECLIVGCGCTFASETKLERHMSMVHFGQSTHVCHHVSCGAAFSTAGNLKRHLRQHHANDGECSVPTSPLLQPLFSAAVPRHQCGIMNSPVAVDRFAGSIDTKNQGFFTALKNEMNSPVAIDSFEDSNTNHQGEMFCWSAPPFLELTVPAPAPPPFLNDSDLFEAIGFLFETNMYSS